MKNSTRYVLSLVAAGLATSCGYTAPYQTSGPALSNEGVQITLAGEQCYVNRSTEEFPTTVDDGVLHVGVNLRVTNRSNQVATLSLDAVQLEEATRSEHAVMHPQQAGTVTLSPGQSTDLALDFTQAEAGSLDCHHDLALDAHSAVAIEGRPASLASIHFQPAR